MVTGVDDGMRRWAHVVDDVVDNISLWDGNTNTWAPPDETRMVELDNDSPVSVGWMYDGKMFEPPAEPEIPASTSVLVAVDPAQLQQLLNETEAATTVLGLRTALSKLLTQLTQQT